MTGKSKVIIYGLGQMYEKQKCYIESRFEVIGYSDVRTNINMPGGIIVPEDLVKYKYDYIYVTSYKYFVEIKKRLIELIGKENEEKIITYVNAFGDFRNSQVRDEWVIDKLLHIPAGKILLDAGAGQQRYKAYCSHLKYIAQDFGKYVPNEVDTGLQLDVWEYAGLNITCDIIDMPLDDESVDVILCTEVFEHLVNPMLALQEFSRILRSGGVMILTAPFCCLTHMAPYFYYNGFSEYWYQKNLEENGFRIKEFMHNGNYFKYISQELFRVNMMAERYCNAGLSSEEMETIIKSMDIMARLSNEDNGSNETLCFGNMVMAEKYKG